ncbi:phospholipase D1-like [Lineus longissimus]|uniref:phospholipase D1-like n=1 Tax=Lineus longissimus TaxID=88925 RepID=UPI00315CD974
MEVSVKINVTSADLGAAAASINGGLDSGDRPGRKAAEGHVYEKLAEEVDESLEDGDTDFIESDVGIGKQEKEAIIVLDRVGGTSDEAKLDRTQADKNKLRSNCHNQEYRIEAPESDESELDVAGINLQDDQNGNKLVVRDDVDTISRITVVSQLSTHSKDEAEIAKILGEEIIPLEFSFSYIHRPSIKNQSLNRISFLPGKEVEVRIVEVKPTGMRLNPWLYVIDCKHDKYEWTIERIHRQFASMQDRLTIFWAETMIPLPTKSNRDRRKTFQRKPPLRLPTFPKRPDVMVLQAQLEERRLRLEKYIRRIVNHPVYQNRPEVCSFFEVCYLSFVNGLGGKAREGLIKKRAGGHSNPGCCPSVSLQFEHRWFVLKDSFLAYMRPLRNEGTLREVMLFDSRFNVELRNHSGLLISNQNRELLVHAKDDSQARSWQEAIQKMMESKGQEFIEKKRFGSFAPIRKNIKAHWFADGRGYMEAVAKTLDQAQEEIFITDWMFSPELHLIRPIEGDHYRLDNLLIRKANEGVKVFIMVYKEFSVAVDLASLHVKRLLTRGNKENIKVLRDPDHVPGGVFFWSHHEKVCIVDQTVALMGGIDLCFGRWDDYQHRLVDLGSMTASESSQQIAKELETDNQVKEALLNAFEPDKPDPGESKEDMETSRKRKMSYSVGAVGFALTLVKRPEKKLEEQPVQPTAKEKAMGRWKKAGNVAKAGAAFTSSIRRRKEEDEELLYQRPRPTKRRGYLGDKCESSDSEEDGATKGNLRNRLKRSFRKKSAGEKFKEKLMRPTSLEQEAAERGLKDLGTLWPGKDYVNFMEKDFTELEKPFEDLIDRRVHPRTPWHDIAAVVTGAAARDLSRHFIQRWNFTKQFKAKENEKYPLLLPKSYDNIEVPEMFNDFGVNCDLQVLRSVGHWSAGVKETEDSIHQASIHAIANAKHYIYIENQFFVSLYESDDVYNEIADALFERIQRAHTNNENFRVYFILPLIPVPAAVITWVYKSICRDKNSILQRLRAIMDDPSQYIGFFGLRNWGELCDELVTQMIYVHSKLMIVDDNTVIIGSANLNDRSLLGKRDSELAIFVQDTEFVNSTMDGKQFKAGKFTLNLRKRLFMEHLGLIDNPDSSISVADPVCPQFWYDVWWKAAKTNTSVYDDVFKVFFSNNVKTLSDLKEYSNVPKLCKLDKVKAKEILITDLRGTVVIIPLQFLENADISMSIGTKEQLVPDIIWT